MEDKYEKSLKETYRKKKRRSRKNWQTAGRKAQKCTEEETMGCCLVQLAEQASHVQRICPCCSGPGFESQPGTLCCKWVPLSLILFPVISKVVLSIKPYKGQKTYLKKKRKRETMSKPGNMANGRVYIFSRWLIIISNRMRSTVHHWSRLIHNMLDSLMQGRLASTCL